MASMGEIPTLGKILGMNVIQRHTPSNFDKAGYRPITGQVVGVIRIATGTVVGLVNLIAAAILTLFCLTPKINLEAAGYSFLAVLRGAAELTGPIGGIALYFIDKSIQNSHAEVF